MSVSSNSPPLPPLPSFTSALIGPSFLSHRLLCFHTQPPSYFYYLLYILSTPSPWISTSHIVPSSSSHTITFTFTQPSPETYSAKTIYILKSSTFSAITPRSLANTNVANSDTTSFLTIFLPPNITLTSQNPTHKPHLNKMKILSNTFKLFKLIFLQL